MSVDAVNSAAEPAILNKALTSFTSEMLLSEISHSLNDSKAEDLVRIDLRGRSTIGDYMLVVSGRSSRQVNAIAQNLADHLKQRLKLTSRLEGKDSGDWIVVDTGDVIVHIFRPEVREFYQLEKMWQSNIADASNV
ncbi:MAG: ribosome silencing factor [Paracoccaceae bacterium]